MAGLKSGTSSAPSAGAPGEKPVLALAGSVARPGSTKFFGKPWRCGVGVWAMAPVAERPQARRITATWRAR